MSANRMAADHITMDIDELMRSDEDGELWKKHSIYRIPSHMKEENPRAYSPQMVSIGPYHYGAPHLAAMQAHKVRSLRHFLKRTNKSLEYYIDALTPLTDELLDSYQLLDGSWRANPTKFLKLMVLDAAFLYEFNKRPRTADSRDYDRNDPVFNLDLDRKISNGIMHDVVKMENQIPFAVTTKLNLPAQTGKDNEKLGEEEAQHDEEKIELDEEEAQHDEEKLELDEEEAQQDEEKIELDEEEDQQDEKGVSPLHSLDIFRRIIIESNNLKSIGKYSDPYAAVKSASELLDAGVQFRAVADSTGGISFENGTLNLPVFQFDNSTEPVFLNVIAFEMLHPTGGREVTSYVAFMQGLISSDRDVKFLSSRGLIDRSSDWNEDTLNMMKKISKNVLFDPFSELCEVRDSLNEYYAHKMKSRRYRMKLRLARWWQKLLQTYFNSPWTILSLLAGTVLLVLTLLQTIYSMKSYYNGSSPSSK